MSEGLAQYYFRQIVVRYCAPFHAQPMLDATNRAAGQHADGGPWGSQRGHANMHCIMLCH